MAAHLFYANGTHLFCVNVVMDFPIGQKKTPRITKMGTLGEFLPLIFVMCGFFVGFNPSKSQSFLLNSAAILVHASVNTKKLISGQALTIF